MTNSQQVAHTILNQLGGNRFCVMTGAKNFVALDLGLRMDLPRNASGANRLEIRLNGKDLYDVRFYSGRLSRKTYEYKVVEKANFKDLYCDQLQEIFTEVTGMYTSL